MSKELVISSNRHETKVAILEDDQLVEIYFQRANEYSLAGSIHKGRVTRVLPGMQSAFVDLGLERDTFLYVSDFLDENGEEYDKIATSADEKAIHRLSAKSDARNESHADAPRQRQSGPPVAAQHSAEEPAAIQPEPAAAPAAPPQERQPERDQRDPRGRRSRRRRMRGGGFPDSKYASDVNVAPANEPADAEPRDVELQESSSDVILLPGESLAKYSNRGMASAAPSAEHAVEEQDESAADVDLDVLPEENAIEQTDTRDNELFSETLAAAFPDPSFVAPPVSRTADQASGRESVSTDIVDATDTVAEPEFESSDADEPETGVDEPQDQSPPSAEEEVEPSESEAEAIIGEADVEETAPAGPVSASVREQSGRYPHRATRRMRRRRGGDRERHTETAAPAGEPAAERQGRDASRESRETPRESRETPRDTRDTARDTRDKPVLPSISDLLREGQEIIVQIAKEPLGQKGARITSHIALPGRYVVYMPTLEHLGVSRKIASDEERQRLKRILQSHRAGTTGGFIVRTAGEGHTEPEIASDMSYLYNLWLDMRQKAEKKPAPVLLHHDLDIVQRILRDQLSDMFKAIWVDSEEIYESVVHFLQRFQPALVGRVKLYTRAIPIFEAFNVTQEIEKALRPKVWLKSGGYIVINQTEALVAIDVNTGKYVGKSNRLEDTITKTNTEAVKEIVRQIRLRDLGGIIVVDFIDMDERKNRQKVMQALEESMRADRAPYKILQFNDFGLVAITRKRVRQSLERTLCSPCPTCEGAAYVKSVMTVVGEILQEATKLRPIVEAKNVVLRTHPDVAKHLKSSRNTYLEEIEEVLGRPVLVTSDPALHPDKFDLAW